MGAHTIGTCYEHVGANWNGQKIVTGEFTGAASYDAGGSVLDLSASFSDEVRGAWVTGRSGEWIGQFIPTVTTNLAATGKVLLRGVSWDDVAITYAHACNDAAATSDNADFWLQPAGSEVLGFRTTLVTKYAATSLSALTIEIGDTGGTDANGFFLTGGADMFADTVGDVGTSIGVCLGTNGGAIPPFLTTAAQRKITSTSTGADMDTLTAGAYTLRCYFTPLTAQGYVGRGTVPEVHAGQVCSGETFTFIAWGTDA